MGEILHVPRIVDETTGEKEKKRPTSVAQTFEMRISCSDTQVGKLLFGTQWAT